jgi:hypothetical protein
MMATVHHSRALPPMPAVARILSQFDRPKLEGFITVAIGLLDVMDGDPEAEPSFSEDDAVLPPWWSDGHRGNGAGCEISDPDYAVDDLPCDACSEDGL